MEWLFSSTRNEPKEQTPRLENSETTGAGVPLPWIGEGGGVGKVIRASQRSLDFDKVLYPSGLRAEEDIWGKTQRLQQVAEKFL